MTQAQTTHPRTELHLGPALVAIGLTAAVIAVVAFAMLRPGQPAADAGVTQAANAAQVEAGRTWQQVHEQQVPGTYAREQALIEAGRDWQRQRELESGTGIGSGFRDLEADHIPTAPGLR